MCVDRVGTLLFNVSTGTCVADGKKVSMNVPCSLRGTFDKEERKFLPVDLNYDCEPDTSCTCRQGFQDTDCSIGEEFRHWALH